MVPSIACAACPGGFFGQGTQEPLTIDRDLVGGVEGFNFPLPVNPGETSLVLLIQTNATAYETGSVSVINSGSVTQTAFQPSVATTLPNKIKNKNRCR